MVPNTTGANVLQVENIISQVHNIKNKLVKTLYSIFVCTVHNIFLVRAYRRTSNIRIILCCYVQHAWRCNFKTAFPVDYNNDINIQLNLNSRATLSELYVYLLCICLRCKLQPSILFTK